MAKSIGKTTWRNLYHYLKHEIRKTWKGYAIIAGGAFWGVLVFLFWILYLHHEFNMKYGK
tara:strand:+ start:122 stop:301 length:180 start_codon:yes stop_codon:yes gene_type:complete